MLCNEFWNLLLRLLRLNLSTKSRKDTSLVSLVISEGFELWEETKIVRSAKLLKLQDLFRHDGNFQKLSYFWGFPAFDQIDLLWVTTLAANRKSQQMNILHATILILLKPSPDFPVKIDNNNILDSWYQNHQTAWYFFLWGTHTWTTNLWLLRPFTLDRLTETSD